MNVQELIDAINQQWEEKLDEIRAEIEQEYKDETEHPYGQGLRRAIEIIDRCRTDRRQKMTIEKCREHILDIMDSMPSDACGDWIDALAYALEIIDKYKTGSEEKENDD